MMNYQKINNKDTKTLNLFSEIAKELAPPPKLTIDEWADTYRLLSSKSSSEPGKWSTKRAPYQKGIMRAISDKRTEMVVMKLGSQVGKTEMLLNTLGYYIDYEPSPIMYLMPTQDFAQEFASTRFMDMVRTVPRLKNKIITQETGRDTKKLKEFLGGYVVFTGAESPSELASRSIKILLVDEIDRFKRAAGKEGDPFELARQRTKNFEGTRKIIVVSTPTVKNDSKIDTLFQQGTQECFYIPCPKCGTFQKLEWRNFNFESNGMKCDDCNEISDEISWKKNRVHGEWLAENKDLVDEDGTMNLKIRSFNINEFYSSWTRWENIKELFLQSKGDIENMKVFTNTVLAETWEEKYDAVDWQKLMARREFYNAEVPNQVLALTAGVDVQGDRLEYEIVGWGLDEECWAIKYGYIMGSPAENYVWEELDKMLDKEYSYEDGRGIKVLSTCVDSGHHSYDVYQFVRTREHRRIFAIKGIGGDGRELVSKPNRNNKARVALFGIGVNTGKEMIFSRLQIENEGSKYFHFPIEEDKGYTEEYFKGLTTEQRITTMRKGIKKTEWKVVGTKRNEPLDLRNYAIAALRIANPNLSSSPIASKKTKRRVLGKGVR